MLDLLIKNKTGCMKKLISSYILFYVRPVGGVFDW